MKPLLYALPFFAILAFAQSPDSKLTQGADNPPQDAAGKARTRAEGSAGGTAQSPLSDEAKRSVGSGSLNRTGPKAAKRVDRDEGPDRTKGENARRH